MHVNVMILIENVLLNGRRGQLRQRKAFVMCESKNRTQKKFSVTIYEIYLMIVLHEPYIRSSLSLTPTLNSNLRINH